MVISILSEEALSEGNTSLQLISEALLSGRRIIAVTGAGISVSAGIPDFRSADGLYARVLSPPTTTSGMTEAVGNHAVRSARGKDFFDASFFHNPATRPIFNRFVAELRTMCLQSQPTPTHRFLKRLLDEGRLMRWYTQNIDGLEAQATRVAQTEQTSSSNLLVSLHGALDRLICTLCRASIAFSEEHQRLFERGESPSCQRCTSFSQKRQENGRRAIKIGTMRPDIVLYNEPHPQGDTIAQYLSADLARRPVVLLVIGTSLRVIGLKRMVRDFARAVHASPNGLVIYVNKTAAPRSEWKTVFDYELVGECDRWIQLIEDIKGAKLGIFCSPFESGPSHENREPSANHAKLPKKDGRIDKAFRFTRHGSTSMVAVKDSKDRQVEDKASSAELKASQGRDVRSTCILKTTNESKELQAAPLTKSDTLHPHQSPLGLASTKDSSPLPSSKSNLSRERLQSEVTAIKQANSFSLKKEDFAPTGPLDNFVIRTRSQQRQCRCKANHTE